jgi:hypothetical protein
MTLAMACSEVGDDTAQGWCDRWTLENLHHGTFPDSTSHVHALGLAAPSAANNKRHDQWHEYPTLASELLSARRESCT